MAGGAVRRGGGPAGRGRDGPAAYLAGHPPHSGRHPDPDDPVVREPEDHGQGQSGPVRPGQPRPSQPDGRPRCAGGAGHCRRAGGGGAVPVLRHGAGLRHPGHRLQPRHEPGAGHQHRSQQGHRAVPLQRAGGPVRGAAVPVSGLCRYQYGPGRCGHRSGGSGHRGGGGQAHLPQLRRPTHRRTGGRRYLLSGVSGHHLRRLRHRSAENVLGAGGGRLFGRAVCEEAVGPEAPCQRRDPSCLKCAM